MKFFEVYGKIPPYYYRNKAMYVQTFNNSFKKGLSDGIPIALGYIAVSFAFGVMAVKGNIPVLLAVLISMTNLTSAGQLAGLSLIISQASLVEAALTQFIINLRYSLMSVSVSQKLHKSVTLPERFAVSFGVTDEIFAVVSGGRQEVGTKYMYGLITLPYFGWASGTLLGALAGSILPAFVLSALGIAIYGMFIAIFIPPLKKCSTVAVVVALASLLSCCFEYLPVLNSVSSGFVIIICACVAAFVGAVLKPVDDQSEVA